MVVHRENPPWVQLEEQLDLNSGSGLPLSSGNLGLEGFDHKALCQKAGRICGSRETGWLGSSRHIWNGIGTSSCQECPHSSAWRCLSQQLSPPCFMELGLGWAQMDGHLCWAVEGREAGGTQHGVGVSGKEKKAKKRVHASSRMSPEPSLKL